MSDKTFRLVTLGRTALLGSDGVELNPISKRRRKLALLAYLALSRRAVSREHLVEMFWGEQDEQRARHSLSDALSELRGHLGADAIETRTTDLILGAKAALTIDARELASACERRDWVRAVSLYGGPFLQGLVVENSSSFEDWVTAERDRLAKLFAQAARERCAALGAARQWPECAGLAERWLEAAPLSADAAITLLEALSAPGTSASAQEAHAAYERLVARLVRDYDMDPDPRVATLASRLAEQAAAAAPGTAAAPFPSERPAPSPASQGPVKQQARAPWPALSLGALVILVGLGLLLARRRASGPRKPTVAVVAVRSLGRDTASAWLENGLKQMITSDLSRNPAVDVVAPERIRAVLERGTLLGKPVLSDDELRRIGNDVGATWVVTGAFTRGQDIYVLDVNLYDVASGKLTRLYTLTGSDPLSVADGAAERVLDAASASAPGPRFATIETSSLEAYQHYMRSQQASAQGHLVEAHRELDAAVALDSGFVSALVDRMRAAIFEDEPGTLNRLREAWRRARLRATPWDVQELETQTALHAGEHAHAEELARELVARFPRDPRAYGLLATVYNYHGRWAAGDTVLVQELSLDSLATEAGHGPCAPCTAYSGLIGERLAIGRIEDAEQAARRWVTLQPDIPASWTDLATTLSFEGRFDEAISAAQRAAALAPDDPEYAVRVGRVLLMARRYDAVDSVIALWRRTGSAGLIEGAFDIEALLERERGQYAASVATLETTTRRFPEDRSLRLEEGNSLGRMGRIDGAQRLYHSQALAAPGPPARDLTPGAELTGDEARAFSWLRSLEADAIGDNADVAVLRALADSVGRVGPLSYYGRDWHLSHHILGIIAQREGRDSDAVREFQEARWGLAGWTRTNARLAQSLIALGKPAAAVAVLREGYAAPLDAMGRYQTRSELDFLLSQAFRAANLPDSAARYDEFARAAWKNADADVRARLAAPPGAVHLRETDATARHR
ncbi:MAG TPA: BTAD domain-containing putative transcriptional regulator [Gemmatimonadales bacterium]